MGRNTWPRSGSSGARPIFLALLLAASCPAPALLSAPSIAVEPGWRRLSRAEAPMPVALTLSGDNVDRRLEVVITGTPGFRLEVELPRRTTKRVFLYTEPETELLSAGYPRLQVRDGAELIHEESLETQVLRSGPLAPVVGGPPLPRGAIAGPAVDPLSLPDRPRGFRSADALIVYPGAWRSIAPKTLEAMVTWVETGGRLILPLISGGERLHLDRGHPFGPLAAGPDREVRGLCWGLQVGLEGDRSMGAGELARSLEIAPWDSITVAGLPATGARPRKYAAEDPTRGAPPVPTVAVLRRGRGSICLLAFDPSGESISKWRHRETFLSLLMSVHEEKDLPRSVSLMLSDISVRDLILLEGGRQPAVGWFALFLLVYLALVGPADYWLVKRLGRPRLTWLTFPALVLLFSLLAWDMGRGRIGALEHREITMIDQGPGLDPGPAGERRGGGLARSLIGIYSDTNSTLTFRPLGQRAELEVLERESGGPSVYRDDGREEDLRQKMHIWAYHGYRAVWRVADPLLSGVLDVEGGQERVTIEQDFPSPPVLVLASREGILHRLRPAEGRKSGRFQADLGESIGADAAIRAALETAWGGPVSSLEPELAFRLAEQDCVCAVLPGPLPALEIAERRPLSSRGFVLVRAPLVVRAEEAAEDAEE